MQTCFIIRRTRSESLHITPYEEVKLSAKWNEDEPLTWYASTGLHTQEKDHALLKIYTQIDRGVDRWIQDARYVPRLLISAAVFLVVYFFFSLAIRDPIPMIDELILATGSAIATAVFIGRRDKKSDMAMKRRLDLKQNASRADFEILEGLSSYEDYLDTCLALDTLDLADRLAKTKKAQLPELTVPQEHRGEWQAEFYSRLLRHVEVTNRRLFERYQKVMSSRRTDVGDEALAARLVKSALRNEIDLPLLALMVAISKQ
ncbi:MAG: hypothetical protein WCS59_01185 [Sphaerochaetaceae bacterium]|jgi:hypothetical protein|nr:hypothetical protein [Sphaerochaetaceae bacterium]MDD3366744.1 hypothetical protein [Sphaerochaetaceae bacterium]MDD4219834.1 hypothetical protein [Sphaerochaetaceae bacterium]MDY0371703.1 hypothetical protein [Sphaerochaetaceae bacterium]